MLTNSFCSDDTNLRGRHRRARQRDRLTETLLRACDTHPEFDLLGCADRFIQVLKSTCSGPAPTIACCDILFRGSIITVVAIPRRFFQNGPTVRFVMEAAGELLGRGEAVVVMSERDAYLLEAGRLDHLDGYFDAALMCAGSHGRTAVRRTIDPPQPEVAEANDARPIITH